MCIDTHHRPGCPRGTSGTRSAPRSRAAVLEGAPEGLTGKMRTANIGPNQEPAQADRVAEVSPAPGIVPSDPAIPHWDPLHAGQEPCGPSHASQPRDAGSGSPQWLSFRADSHARAKCPKPHAAAPRLSYGRPDRRFRQGVAALHSQVPCRTQKGVEEDSGRKGLANTRKCSFPVPLHAEGMPTIREIRSAHLTAKQSRRCSSAAHLDGLARGLSGLSFCDSVERGSASHPP